MITLENAFLFIAKELEGKGAPDMPTVYGITKKFYPEYYNRLKSLIDKNAQQSLIDNSIIDIYKKLYEDYNANRFRLYTPLDIWYFDFALNAGKRRAVKCLQKSIYTALKYPQFSSFAISSPVPDGVWGPQTDEVVREFCNKLLDFHLTSVYISIFILQRRQMYLHLSPARFRCGWINRTLKLEKYLLGV